MAEPARDALDPLELATDEAIAVCDGDVRAALRAAIVANTFLASEVERLSEAVSFGFARGKLSPGRQASEMLERWREIMKGDEVAVSQETKSPPK